MDAAPGIDEIHLLDAEPGAPTRLCLHYDPAITNVARIRSLADAAGARLTQQFGHELRAVSGISTVRQARRIAESLRRLDGVVEADVTPGIVRVEFDRERLDDEALDQALARLGVRDGSADSHEGHSHDHARGPFGERSELVFAVSSAVLWLVGFVLELTGSFPEGVSVACFVAAALLGGYYTAIEAFESVVTTRRFEIDFLMLVAALGAAILGKWAESALLLALFSVGHALEGYAMGRARRAVEALAELAPDTAVRRDGTGEQEVPVADLTVGDTIVVKPNERIAADGFVVLGASSVNQAPLTGESIPVDKVAVVDVAVAAADPDDIGAASRVFAGTINGAGQIDVQVTRSSGDSTLAKLVTLVREAETQASPTQRFTDRFERLFVPAVLGLVVAVLVIESFLGSSFSASFYRAMAVLVAASPCALAIATPSAVLAAVARAGHLGVLVKGGGPLENLGRVRAIAFDKTGTLTEGRPKLTDVVLIDANTEPELLAVAVAVEASSDHPLASAIVRDGRARLEGAVLPRATGVTAITGRGVQGEVDGIPVRIGNVALFDEDGGVSPSVETAVENLQLAGRTTMIVKLGDRFMGVVGVMDTPRASAPGAVTALRKLGVRRAVMLSGDDQRVADAVAVELGLTEAWGNLMPEDKVSAIERLRTEDGAVAMVGDGVNDAPALAHATVGIAMGAAGSDVALETADVALMGDDLAALPRVVGLGRAASRIIRQNLYVSLGMVALLVPTTALGIVGIGPAVLLHEGSTLIVVANALRLLAYDSRSD